VNTSPFIADLRSTFRLYARALGCMSVLALITALLFGPTVAFFATPVFALVVALAQYRLSIMAAQASLPASRLFDATSRLSNLNVSYRQLVSAIVTADNDHATVGRLLDSLMDAVEIQEIVVVSDGSVDATVDIARQYDGVRTIALRERHGRGFALQVGVANATNDILIVIDASIPWLDSTQVSRVVSPVASGQCDMNVAIQDRGALLNLLHLKLHLWPILSRLRALRRDVSETVPVQYGRPDIYELALNHFADRAGYRQQHTIVAGLSTSAKKRPFAEQVSRMRNLLLGFFDLYVFEAWRWTAHDDQQLRYRHDYDIFE
jgi:glycosyltransferase involved in cell wall biosynthesis